MGSSWHYTHKKNLPDHFVLAESTNSLKSRLYNYRKTKRLLIIISVKSRKPEAEARLVESYNFLYNVYNIGIWEVVTETYTWEWDRFSTYTSTSGSLVYVWLAAEKTNINTRGHNYSTISYVSPLPLHGDIVTCFVFVF